MAVCDLVSWSWVFSYRSESLDTVIKDAAWYYANPYEKAMNIKDHVAFCELKCS